MFVGEVERGAPPRWLTLSGSYGRGKTFLGRQTYLEARKHCLAATGNWPGQVGIYEERNRRPDCRQLDEARFARLMLDDKQWDLPEHIAHEWLVFFDDLGTKGVSDRAREVVNDGIVRLANQRLGKWTIWTTNLGLGEIETRVDGRVASRLIRDGNRLVTITAPDYALRKR